MARPLMPTQHKLAEKLTILNHRGAGMLIRIYNIKKVFICLFVLLQYFRSVLHQVDKHPSPFTLAYLTWILGSSVRGKLSRMLFNARSLYSYCEVVHLIE